eukprot:4599584-Prorocentrum_lima.AAC.1
MRAQSCTGPVTQWSGCGTQCDDVHQLVRTGVYVVCRVCGAYGTRKVQALAQQKCSGPLSSNLPSHVKRRQRRDRLLSGRHPVTNRVM